MALSMSGLWEIFTDLLCSPLWREHNQRQTQLQTDWWINHVLSHLVYPLFVVVFAPLLMTSGAQRTDKSSREGLTLVPTLRYIRSLHTRTLWLRNTIPSAHARTLVLNCMVWNCA